MLERQAAAAVALLLSHGAGIEVRDKSTWTPAVLGGVIGES